MDVPARFWDIAEQMVAEAELVIDRPKGARHPRFPHIIYPLDYGYLDGTVSVADGEGVDVWRGSGPARVTGMLCSIDLTKLDTEVKILYACTDEEIAIIHDFHNSYDAMASALVRRPG